MTHNYCIIMAGGVGSRFWPLSRTEKPKQFLDILGTGKSLLRMTYERFVKVIPNERIYIVTNNDYLELVKEELPELAVANIICEPARRNTAPCIAYASYKIHAIDPKAVTVVTPSDHLILNEDIFLENVMLGFESAAKTNSLMTIGIKPTRPDTGYGYIQFSDNPKKSLAPTIKQVKTFTEKPELELAKTFVESGEFVWNAGIFIWSLKNILVAFEEHLPEVNDLFKENLKVYNTNKEWDFIRQTYLMCPSISIDNGILEKANNVFVIEAGFGWSDLGTWGSVYDQTKKDTLKNAVIGKHAMFYNSSNNMVRVPADKLVVIQGLDNYIVIDTESALLICKKEAEQEIKEIVNQVKIEKGENFV
jgi:mannose-1-phosphate guanylyltransferase